MHLQHIDPRSTTIHCRRHGRIRTQATAAKEETTSGHFLISVTKNLVQVANGGFAGTRDEDYFPGTRAKTGRLEMFWSSSLHTTPAGSALDRLRTNFGSIICKLPFVEDYSLTKIDSCKFCLRKNFHT